ncbi:MAG: carbamoyl-phosphate synthase large subunit [Treponema porcinum]|uniref:carbamoyl-phosphate synthase large subunit n=2 Tax=Treponema porcinum TaxID=261392 RepID=UPI002A812B72|nr:carbamoyl-phosphate synthase large subunit [Treponema porcinum]MDY5121334.1 carbamoyl-phosphate synthase large subunit [Treponema porcinum]
MPLNKNIHKVMVIGSGPIVIGQAAEFDYAGTQACKALKEQGLEVVLVNSNPATLMTDHSMADAIYIEPLIPETIQRIIEKEKPDSLLSTLGGQTGLTLSMELAKSGFLASHGVQLLGARPETIDKAEDRQMFKDTMLSIGEPCIPSKVVTTYEDAADFVHNEIGFPAIIRPAFTLGGTGGGIVHNDAELDEIAHNGLHRSPIHQILVEKCISGWKEVEFEVIRDASGNVITVCSMENFDPVGVHTGDSIVIAPAVTLADKEYQMLRSAALNIISALKIEGGCNCQFALNPETFEYAVIEVNPRVSRSSALASKATGYPIAKVAALIAIGYNLDEIPNFVTKKTAACFEPVLDYVVVKFPKFPFDKFVYAARKLGTQMKATGEVMAIGRTFEEALMKAVRGAEIGVTSLNLPVFEEESDEKIKERVSQCTDQRLFAVFQALKRNIMSVDEIHAVTMIDEWFLNKMMKLVSMEKTFLSVKDGKAELSADLYLEAKKNGYPDKVIEKMTGISIPGSTGIITEAEKATTLRAEGKLAHIPATYKMVDTCAGEFNAETPYFYGGFDAENEAASFLKDMEANKKRSSKGTIIVLGSGPIRIGQGIEFDYASVQCVWSLKKLGYEVAIINNNPETVSTDFDTADRLYFEPLTPEDVMSVINTEKPIGVVVAFGGQTAIKLTKFLDSQGIRILGTSADSIDLAEDRERFEELCEKLNINRPKGLTIFTEQEALEATAKLGYPVLLRPSYVLGGQNMIVAFNDDDVKEYMKIILAQGIENPVLIDQYMMGIELEVDGICDGEDVLIPGIMEHIERTGIHSGDSIAVYPSWNLNDVLREKIVRQSKDLAIKLGTKGLVNIQYLIYNNDLYIIEVNPRSSRTVPYISKVTGVPMVELATRAMLGEKIKDMGYGTGLYRIPPYFAVKVPVFSFEKLMDVDTHLGPEMKSTGEVLGIASTMEEALFKGLIGAGYNMKRSGGVLFSVRKTDRYELPELARKFYDMGFKLYATEGNAKTLQDFGMEVTVVNKIHENPNDNLLTLLDSGKIDYVISTSAKGRDPRADSVKMRRHAVERDIPCLTAIDTANALANCLASHYSAENVELININDLRTSKQTIKFTKMQSTGNDFIIIDTREQFINNPGGLAVRLCNRRSGIGADSLVLVGKTEKADASMKFFNLDGSEGKMAGNAIRAVAKYLYDNNINGIADKHDKNDTTVSISIKTASGIKMLTAYKLNGKVSSVMVDMGKPSFTAESLPTTLKEVPLNVPGLPEKAIVNEQLTVDGMNYDVTCVSVGNPHCVVFCGFVDKVDLQKIGPEFENNPVFPERTNTEFVRVVGPNELKMRTWERGNGETPACGTGACAAVIAAVLNGYCKMNENITVNVRGGKMIVKYTGDSVYLSGNTELLYEGDITI